MFRIYNLISKHMNPNPYFGYKQLNHQTQNEEQHVGDEKRY